jgi:predicted membrane protein
VKKLPEIVRKRIYVLSGCLVQIGVFAMRWNVVIGGQLFSKSFLGYTSYKMSLITKEGLLMAIFLSILPLFILWGLVKLLPPWDGESQDSIPAVTTAN